MGEAIPLFEDAVKWRTVKLGPNHGHTLATMDNLANAYRTAGRLPEALPLFEETVARMTAELGPNHPDTLTAMNNMAIAFGAAGKPNEKVAALEKSVEAAKVAFGPDHPETLTGMNNLAVAYWEARKARQAIPLIEQTVELRLAKIGADHPYTLRSLRSLGVMYTRYGVGPDPKSCYLTCLPALRNRLPADSLVWVAATEATAGQLLADRNYATAEPLLRECLATRGVKQSDSWETFHTKSRLGAALARQGKHAAAEPLLLAGYEGLTRREAGIPLQCRVHLTQALERLVELYSTSGRADEAGRWQKRLDTHRQREPGVRSLPADR